MIVNPWFFYLMSLCNGILTTAIIVAIISGSAAILVGIPLGLAVVDGDVREVEKALKFEKMLIAVFAVAMLVYIVTPSENTLLMMQAARLTTPYNVDAVFEALKSAIDYAVDVLK